MVTLWGRRWSRAELLARVGRLEQLAGVRLVEGGDGAERGVRLLRVSTGAGFDRVDPAGNLDLMIKQLSHSEEALDGKR